eukprot:5395487-Prymnesium_polylepis.1
MEDRSGTPLPERMAHQCVICYDDDGDMTTCDEGHGVCDLCFLQYMESLPDFRVRRVPCPLERLHGCSAFSAGDLANVFLRVGEPRPLERLLERCGAT